ncbi:16S rRNA (uracil(1498)-N(3))-methyltransferase [Flavobacteriaceae bacterium]|nr:16S rRNA (uracil(1498)-N(3))-methyltransferase [Flavobacteriaceae bacterium]
MQLFYASDIDANQNSYRFDKTESRHIVKVLRKLEGDRLNLTDGAGNHFDCIITQANDKRCIVAIEQVNPIEKDWDYYLHIAIAPTKLNDRLEWFLEKATEIGLDEITPILCDHSERKTIKEERYEKILVSAMKQSLKFRLPKLNKLTKFSEFIKRPLPENSYIAHCEDREQQLLKNQSLKNEILIMIGPEGDFSSKEIDLALNRAVKGISLGKSRLRTETAALVACDTVSILNQ